MTDKTITINKDDLSNLLVEVSAKTLEKIIDKEKEPDAFVYTTIVYARLCASITDELFGSDSEEVN